MPGLPGPVGSIGSEAGAPHCTRQLGPAPEPAQEGWVLFPYCFVVPACESGLRSGAACEEGLGGNPGSGESKTFSFL